MIVYVLCEGEETDGRETAEVLRVARLNLADIAADTSSEVLHHVNGANTQVTVRSGSVTLPAACDAGTIATYREVPGFDLAGAGADFAQLFGIGFFVLLPFLAILYGLGRVMALLGWAR